MLENVDSTRTCEIAKAIKLKNYELNPGKTAKDAKSWSQLYDNEKLTMLETASIVEVCMNNFALAAAHDDLVETVTGAMVEGYFPASDYESAPTDLKIHWRELAKVGIEAYRKHLDKPSFDTGKKYEVAT